MEIAHRAGLETDETCGHAGAHREVLRVDDAYFSSGATHRGIHGTHFEGVLLRRCDAAPPDSSAICSQRWTHQVTQRELPPSDQLAGVNMRLTAGSFRELHWHTADEWALMEYGNARVSVMNPDGTMFLDEITEGDLWFFPAGYPHSIQGLGPDGYQFLLVFDQGMFSEDNTFLLSEFVAHIPHDVLQKNSRLTPSDIAKPTPATAIPQRFFISPPGLADCRTPRQR